MKNREFIPVLDQPHFVRDKQSKAILNTNVEGQIAYRKQREERLKIKKMLSEFEGVKEDLHDIKELLQKLLNK